MPGTEKQRKAAGAELNRRRKGVGKSKGRPFGTASIADLKDYASKVSSRMKKNRG